MKNIFENLSDSSVQENFEDIIENKSFRLERIVSTGQHTPEGEWLTSQQDEWILLLKGKAGLRFKDESETLELNVGDYLLISANRQHRVEWTQPTTPTVWLALHYLPNVADI